MTRLVPTSTQKDFWWMYPVPSIFAGVKLATRPSPSPRSKAASNCPILSDGANTFPIGGPFITWQSPESVTVAAKAESSLKSMLVK